ncbi:MAG: hypothetical protein EBS23_10230, partial [Betaproteobacteria bacterium]|nr:hypothetical protein [Betaproteobacteria bacterium]
LIKSGNASLTLSGTNTYTGGTAISAGTVVAGDDSAFGTGAVTFADGTTLRALDSQGLPRTLSNNVTLNGRTTVHVPFGNATDIILSGVISGAGSLGLTSDFNGRWLSLSGNNTFTGGVEIFADSGSNPNIRVAHSNALGTGTLTITGTPRTGTDQLIAVANNLNLANAVSLGSGASFGINTNGNTLTMSGVMSGTGALRKNGTGTLTLSGANTYTGSTTIGTGTLSLTAAGGNGGLKTSGFDVSSGATLNFNVTSGIRDYIQSGSVAFTGSGTLTKTGAGTLKFGAGSATFSLGSGALIDLKEGGFIASSSGNEIWTNNRASLNVASGTTFDGTAGVIRVDALTGAGTVTSGWDGTQWGITVGVDNFAAGVYNTAGNSVFSGVLRNTVEQDAGGTRFGRLIKEGTGTLTLSGSNIYSGSTTVNAGSINVTGTLGASANYGGTIAISSGASLT